MVRALAILAALGSCAEAGPIVSSTTDGASWEVSIDTPKWPAGEGTLRLTVRTPDDTAGTGLDVLLITGMGDMPHAADAEWCTEEEAGVYACPVRFTMPGLWNVEGTVSAGEEAESFHLVVAVE